MNNTILYLTDNSLDERIATTCRRILLREAQGQPIVCVSQKPVDWPEAQNVVVGEIGRNWISLYRQLLAGIDVAQTDWVVVAEHDVIYPACHLQYQPDDPSMFHYNLNVWLVVGPGSNHPEIEGMFSYWVNKDRSPRLVLSQLICHKELLRASLTERLNILENGADWDKQFLGCGEPGVVSTRALEKARTYAVSGHPVQLQPYLADYLTKYQHETFETEIPTIDIRHGTNFTGAKRGSRRRYELPYWGRWSDIWGAE